MSKRKKIPREIKTRITKMYLAGKDLDEIRAAVREKMSRITTARIRTVIRKYLTNRADELWAQAVKLRDGNCCAVCKRRGRLEAHHLIGRVNGRFRWALPNGIALCARHHTLDHDVAAHGSNDVTTRFNCWLVVNREWQWRWFIENQNDRQAEESLDIEELAETVKHLQAKIKEFKNGSYRRKNLAERGRATKAADEVRVQA